MVFVPLEYVILFGFLFLAFVCTVCVVIQVIIYVKDCVHDYKLDCIILRELEEEYRKGIENAEEDAAED